MQGGAMKLIVYKFKSVIKNCTSYGKYYYRLFKDTKSGVINDRISN